MSFNFVQVLMCINKYLNYYKIKQLNTRVPPNKLREHILHVKSSEICHVRHMHLLIQYYDNLSVYMYTFKIKEYRCRLKAKLKNTFIYYVNLNSYLSY